MHTHARYTVFFDYIICVFFWWRKNRIYSQNTIIVKKENTRTKSPARTVIIYIYIYIIIIIHAHTRTRNKERKIQRKKI